MNTGIMIQEITKTGSSKTGFHKTGYKEGRIKRNRIYGFRTPFYGFSRITGNLRLIELG
jgi:hypothetical protein